MQGMTNIEFIILGIIAVEGSNKFHPESYRIWTALNSEIIKRFKSGWKQHDFFQVEEIWQATPQRLELIDPLMSSLIYSDKAEWNK